MSHFDYRKLVRSFHYAVRGLYRLIQDEQNTRVHLIATLFLIVLTIIFRISAIEIGVLFFAVAQVFAIEITNTAIEKLLDIVHPETHSQIAYIKDALAGAVLIASLIALGVAFFIFIPHILALT